MAKAKVLAGHTAALSVGIVLGGVVALVAATLLTQALGGTETTGDAKRPPLRASDPTHPIETSTATRGADGPLLLLAWASGGLPPRTQQSLENHPQVQRATTVVAGVDWLKASRRPDGSSVERHAGGFAVPLEVAVIDPKRYAAFAPPAERRDILALERGEALLAETEADIRSLSGEGVLELVDRDVTVAGTVSDVAANGYELLVAGPPPASWERSDRFVLFHLRSENARNAIERRLDRLLGAGQRFRVRAKGETPFLRYGDAVLPQMMIKDVFGEFAARPLPTGSIDIDDAWRDKNIVDAPVPILGRVTCHRTLIPQLRAALRQVAQEGLGFTINTAQYGGCYGPRFIGSVPGGRLSHHAWGAAIDINVAENAFGTKADQDRRLVDIFEGHGFTWGGRWLVPDGMHFEWVAFP